MEPAAIVISGDGINCELETSYALELAGMRPEIRHIGEVLSNRAILDRASLLVFPGGFSFGDEIASGKVLAIKWMDKMSDATMRFIESGRLVLGICNGFQMLVQMCLLPETSTSASKSISLIHNKNGRFVNKWVPLTVTGGAANRGYFEGLANIELPIRHGEGRIHPHPEKASLVAKHAALRYVNDVNGSFDRIAALTNASGNVMGMMPHPEAFVRNSQHPAWSDSRERNSLAKKTPDGLLILKNACRMARNL